MKYVLLNFIFILLTLFGYGNPPDKKLKPVKIACVGNSITYGAGMVNRLKNAYPSQLQELLGEEYLVENFGVSGRTLLKKGDLPYMKSKAYRKALNFVPDLVYIMLGTNDSKLQNRVFLNEFEADYTELIQNFKQKNSKVKIVILLPIPSFLEDTSSIWNPVIKNKIIPKLQNIAYKTGAEVIDLYQLFIDKPQLLPDKIHPSSLGATLIAKRIYENIKDPFVDNFNLMDNLDLRVEGESNFYGFQQVDFQYKGISCKIVQPKKVAKGYPWVLRARFWGHQPQTDIALLERGFHIAYCDVAGLFGNVEAVKRWDNFYKLLTKKGLSKKVVLEGMSRGGLIVYNFADKFPKRIACVYVDAPVLNSMSWPGGFGNGKGNKSDWEEFKKVNKLITENNMESFAGDPIHKTEGIAKGGYPMLHICGENDQIVPIEENTRVFEKEIKQAGGDIRVIYKKEIGHHPHSLENPSPIVNFILIATGNKINFAGIPAPGSEYRSAAGWKEGKDWWAQAEDIDFLCQNSGKIDLLLIGNSITQGWGGSRTLITAKPGNNAANKYFKDLKWLNAGISGDRVQHIAWRVKNGNYEKCQPDYIVLAIGVNNFKDNSGQEIADGIVMDLEWIKKKFTDSSILLFGPLPTGIKLDSDSRKKYNEIHGIIKDLGENQGITYHNVLGLFKNKDGSLNEKYISKDGIHLLPKGYEIWADYISKNMVK